MSEVESLINAIKSNDVALFSSMIARGVANVNARIGGSKNDTLLMLAAEHGRVEIVALLLDAGAHIDDVNIFQNTACHVAAMSGHTAAVELLAARKPNVSLKNLMGWTPINVAINDKNERLVLLLIDAAMAAGTLDDETVCQAATVSADVIRFLLLKHRINLGTVRDSNGCTPLHQAARCSNDAADVIEMLVDVADVDIDARDKNGLTAAHVASMLRNVRALAHLIAAGANLDLANVNGN